mmetsp:Transcript_3938/g.8833  ORF Transcript_3938/g.8833 Transcript_3938/m.8833 type:complete len:85 (+) Transcript_3938:154-408(+)
MNDGQMNVLTHENDHFDCADSQLQPEIIGVAAVYDEVVVEEEILDAQPEAFVGCGHPLNSVDRGCACYFSGLHSSRKRFYDFSG